MTSPEHISGTDRVCEAANKLNLDDNTFILNLQGDEPFLPNELISNVINDYFKNSSNVITVSTNISSGLTLGSNTFLFGLKIVWLAVFSSTFF